MDNKTLNTLINQFQKFPNVGFRTASRYAYQIIDMPENEVEVFIQSIRDVKAKMQYCSVCGALSETPVCKICQTRSNSTICVVKETRDVEIIEKMGSYNGVYHVLQGTLSPLNGITPDKLTISLLLKRLDNVEEVILALSPDVEGDATAFYLAKLLKQLGVKVTKLAQGLPMGQDIQYADEPTLTRALLNRTEL